jgi:nicotinamide-nucleotide amidase
VWVKGSDLAFSIPAFNLTVFINCQNNFMDKDVNAFISSLKKKKLKLALAESVTCGLAAHKLASALGTSDVLAGSVVCYSPEVKISLLGISHSLIDTYTCESQQVTDALARHLPRLIKADIYAALTGLASPGGSETPKKPVGTVFFSVRYKNKTHSLKKQFRGTPLTIRKKACMALYKFILEVL